MTRYLLPLLLLASCAEPERHIPEGDIHAAARLLADLVEAGTPQSVDTLDGYKSVIPDAVDAVMAIYAQPARSEPVVAEEPPR